MAALVQQVTPAPWAARYGKPHEPVGRGVLPGTKVGGQPVKNPAAGSQSMQLRSVQYRPRDADNRTRDDLQSSSSVTSLRVPFDSEKPTQAQGSRQVNSPLQGSRDVLSSTASLPSTPPTDTRNVRGVGNGALVNYAQNEAQQLQVRELQTLLQRAREESAAKDKLLADQAEEMSELVAIKQQLEVDLLRSRAEGARLRAELRSQRQSTGQMQQSTLDEDREAAAIRIQRGTRKWLARQHGQRVVRSDSSERWKFTLKRVENATRRALDTMLDKDDDGEINGVQRNICLQAGSVRNTRLQLLANTLQQGVLKVNQVMMHETLQDLRRSGPLSELGRLSGQPYMFEPGALEN